MNDRPSSNSCIARLGWVTAELALLAGFYAIVWYAVSHSAPQPPTSYLSSEFSAALARGDSRSFLKAAAVLTEVDRTDDEGMTLLMLAVDKSNPDAVAGLLDMGADVNRACPAYGTPLTLALGWGDAKIASLLLCRGAKANVVTREHDTPLLAAARSGSADAVRLILPHVKEPFPESALENPLNALALETSQLDSLRMLLKAGTDPNRAGRNGELPLVSTAAAGSPEAVALLLRAGADPFKRSRYGKDAWMAAAQRPAILQVLHCEAARAGGKTS